MAESLLLNCAMYFRKAFFASPPTRLTNMLKALAAVSFTFTSLPVSLDLGVPSLAWLTLSPSCFSASSWPWPLAWSFSFWPGSSPCSAGFHASASGAASCWPPDGAWAAVALHTGSWPRSAAAADFDSASPSPALLQATLDAITSFKAVKRFFANLDSFLTSSSMSMSAVTLLRAVFKSSMVEVTEGYGFSRLRPQHHPCQTMAPSWSWPSCPPWWKTLAPKTPQHHVFWTGWWKQLL